MSRPIKAGRVQLLLVLVLAVSALLLSQTRLLEPLDQALYDLQSRLLQRQPDPAIRVVVIDDDALAALGRWPWPRRIHADLVRRLTAAGVRGIGLDILFSEPDDDDPEGDRLLAAAIRDSGRVVLPVYPRLDSRTGRLLEQLPIPLLRESARLGHVDAELDSDGVARSVFLQAGLGEPRWPAFSLALLQLDPPAGWDWPPSQRAPATDVSAASLWSRDRRILIPFAGPPGHFRPLSYLDVLDRPAGSLGLEGTWVLVGVVASGLQDTLAVPSSDRYRAMAGVEFNANVLDALLNGEAIRPLGSGQNALLSLLLTLVPLALYRLRPRRALWSWLGSLSLVLGVGMMLLIGAKLWFPQATALLLAGVSYPLWLWLRVDSQLQRTQLEHQVVRDSLTALGQGLISTDAAGRVEYLNAPAERLVGRSLDQVRGRPVTEVLDFEGDPAPDPAADAGAHGREPCRCRVSRGDAASPPMWLTMRTMRDKTGGIHGRVLTLHDRAPDGPPADGEEAATHLDLLTGLPNRTLMVIQLQQALARASRSGGEMTLLYVRLERLRRINASMGYRAVEQLLQEVASRLRDCVRESDMVARNGSDEFTVILDDPNANGHSAAQVGRKLLAELTRPYTLGDQVVQLLVHIGVGIYPHDGKDAEELLRNAYSAVAHATGASGMAYFSRQIQEHAEQRRRLESDLSGALDRGELELYFQPQVEIASGRTVAAEILLRWHREGGAEVAPLDFIAIAEESGLIHQIGDWVFDRACRQIARWLEQGLSPPRLAVNVSPVQLERDLLPKMVRVMQRNRVDPRYLELELTEGAIVRTMESTSSILRRFRELGGSIAVDDFGTGYSTFSYLRQLPVNRLKIDKSFVHDMTLHQDDAIIVLSIISMARGLNLEVVAEGVETAEQLRVLKRHGCHVAQGYLFSRPVSAAEFTAMIGNPSGGLLAG